MTTPVPCSGNPGCEVSVLKTKPINELDKLSKMLGSLARNIPLVKQHEEKKIRPRLIKKLRAWGAASIETGRLLSEYREAYRAVGDREWMSVIKTIAMASGCSDRTLRRLIERYAEVAFLPESVRSELSAAGIDPMKATSGCVIGNLRQMIAPGSKTSPAQAIELVKQAQPRALSDRSPSLSKEQKILWNERLAVRRIIARYPDPRKIDAVINALAQELFDIYGMTEPVDVTVEPYPGPFTVDGMLRTDKHELEINPDETLVAA